MALIKLTAIVDNISGKLNGTVFAKNKGGHYMRSKSNPTNPRTEAQQENRGWFGAISSLWRSLAQAQRNAWDNAAQDFPYQNRLGDTKVLSGFNLFQKLNRNLALAGLFQSAELFHPPMPRTTSVPHFVGGSFGVSTVGGSNLAEVEIEINENQDAQTALVYVTAPLSPGIKNFDSRLRLLTKALIPALSDQATVDITTAYMMQFGLPNPDEKIGFAVRIVNNITGQASDRVRGSVMTYETD